MCAIIKCGAMRLSSYWRTLRNVSCACCRRLAFRFHDTSGVTCGDRHCCGILTSLSTRSLKFREEDNVVCWGNNWNNQRDVPGPIAGPHVFIARLLQLSHTLCYCSAHAPADLRADVQAFLVMDGGRKDNRASCLVAVLKTSAASSMPAALEHVRATRPRHKRLPKCGERPTGNPNSAVC